jgi:plasmid stability protein
MSQITIRNMHPEVIRRLKDLVRINGRSMEGEIRALLRILVGVEMRIPPGLTNYPSLEKMGIENMKALLKDMNTHAKHQKASTSAAPQLDTNHPVA